jgi:hypothetical protein
VLVVCHVFVDSCLTGATAVARNTPGTRTSSRGRAVDESNAAPPPRAPLPVLIAEVVDDYGHVVCHMGFGVLGFGSGVQSRSGAGNVKCQIACVFTAIISRTARIIG